MTLTTLAVLAGLVAAVPQDSSPGAPPASPPLEIRLDLRALMERAAAQYPELAIVAAERDGARALEEQAFYTRFTPKLKNTGVFGLIPAARGDIFSSPDTNRDLNDLGPFYRLRVELSQPLYAFGRIARAQEAAKAFVASKDAKAEAKADVARELAARAYFGYLAAERGLDLLADVRRDLDELIEKLEHPAEGEEPDPLDALKARSHVFQLEKLEAQAERQLRIAAAALDALAGTPGGEGPVAHVRPAAREIVALDAPLEDVEAGIARALARSPELRELDLGIRAKQLWAESERREAFPALGLEGRFDIGAASNRDKQDNPFVYDPVNVRTLTAAFAFQWNMNFFQTRSEYRKSASEAAELRAKREGLVRKLGVDLREAHARLVETRKVHDASRRALSTTANWLRLAEENHGLGIASMKELVDAYQAFVTTKSAQLEAIHDLNLAVIDWRLATGAPALAEGEAP